MSYSRTPFYIYPTEIGGERWVSFADVAATVPYRMLAVWLFRAKQRGELETLLKLGQRLYELDIDQDPDLKPRKSAKTPEYPLKDRPWTENE